jgi:hypothetical protein
MLEVVSPRVAEASVDVVDIVERLKSKLKSKVESS